MVSNLEAQLSNENPLLLLPPEIMNNVGVIRMEMANQMKQQSPQEAEMKINLSFEAFEIALKSVNCRLQTKENDDVQMEVEE